MLLFLSILGLILSAILLVYGIGRSTSSIYLGFFFFLVSLYSFIEYVVVYSKFVPLVAAIFLNLGFISYLTGPVLYWYFRSVLNDDSHLKKKDLWHLLPMLIFLVGTMNYIVTPWPFKLEIATRLVENRNFIGEFEYVYLYQLIPKHLVYLSRPVLIFIYAIFSLAAMVRFIRKKAATNVFARPTYVIKWLSVLLGFLFVLIVSHTLFLKESFAKQDSNLFYTLNLMQTLSFIGLTGLMISTFFFPGILYGLPQLPTPNDSSLKNDENKGFLNKSQSKSKKNFKTDYLQSIEQKTNACMKELQPYLQADCNLATIAKLTQIPAHHLSWFFREIKHQTFNDYRNQWRVEHAKNLILEGRSSDLSMEGIGLLSGFSSRNAFYNAFKKVVNSSPSAFASQIKNE